MVRFLLILVLLLNISAFCYGQQIEFYYTVKSGDTLIKISEKKNISLEKLHKLNPQITDIFKIYEGDIIRLDESVPEIQPKK